MRAESPYIASDILRALNPSLEEDVVSCCARGAGFDSTSRALALSVGRDTGHLSAQVSREPIQIGPGGASEAVISGHPGSFAM